jgi:hypothetical protein
LDIWIIFIVAYEWCVCDTQFLILSFTRLNGHVARSYWHRLTKFIMLLHQSNLSIFFYLFMQGNSSAADWNEKFW